ncbi:hypothetical protein APA73_34155 [Pseudomonas aeruginosa]|nr:hypothetical protein APA58_33160 [Pseudomonas aeruginosa]OPE17711.1 hypothetical protein APA73_34155 [Pseudomonas aeruginosa]
MFSCSKIEQVQWNTWVSFQSAQWAKLGQFSVSGNTQRQRPEAHAELTGKRVPQRPDAYLSPCP